MSEESKKEETGLTVPGMDVALAKTDAAMDEAMDEAIPSTGFQRIQLFGSSSDVVKRGDFPMGHLGIVDGKEITDLGESFDCFVLGYRLKAMRFGDEMEVLFDHEDAAFKAIVEESKEKDSDCMFGPEFLLWIPEHGFVPYHLNNKSAQYEAKPMRALVAQAATIKVVFIEGKEFSWHAPKVTKCTVPLDSQPNADEVKAEMHKFRNPEIVQSEMAESTKDAPKR